MKKILLINPIFDEIFPLAKLLRRLGYIVCMEGFGEKANKALGGTLFDLILVTDELADMPGFDFITRIKYPGYRRKIIFLTKRCRSGERKEAASLGIERYIPRSVSWVDLAILIDRAVGGRNALCLN